MFLRGSPDGFSFRKTNTYIDVLGERNDGGRAIADDDTRRPFAVLVREVVDVPGFTRRHTETSGDKCKAQSSVGHDDHNQMA